MTLQPQGNLRMTKRLWEQDLPPSREANLGAEMKHKNRGACSSYGICCDAEHNLPPTASSSWQSARPTDSFTRTVVFLVAP